MTARKSKPKAVDPAASSGADKDRGSPTAIPDPLKAAKTLIGPSTRHGQAFAQLLKANLEGAAWAPDASDYGDAIFLRASNAEAGDLRFASRLLAAQATTLDGVFTEMVRRMALNMGDYLGATETYARIAMKAQAGCRATLAELAKLHQPREQTVRHVHVNEGGQAVITDEFHHHTGGQKNGQSSGQPHATGTGAAGKSPALSGPDPIGQPVPVAGDQGGQAVPNARGQRQRRT
ncbi:hypothetical protein [Novosphingobium aquae]|uniref:Phasin domain-containing protein n=1 Tax=Novosphingobium aquae TaxID=3133435 RepID=A0ABU8S873_9SPHN